MALENRAPAEEETLDRRDVIEKAFEEAEASAGAPEVAKPAPEAAAPEVAKPAPEAAAPETAKPAPEAAAPEAGKPAPEAGKPEGGERIDRAPQSWKPAARATWEQIDPGARAEIVRRENQIARALDETAGARRFTEEFQRATQPFAARLQAMNAHPLAVYTELLKVDHTLSQGSKAERAALVARIVKDYDVDIEALDAALVGRLNAEADPQSQIDAQVERMLQQRLAPFQSLLQREQQREVQESQTVASEIERMASDADKYPYFHDVRMEMADILDLAAKRGAPMSLADAYNRAVMLDPQISKLVEAQAQKDRAAKAAAEQNARAQRARNASVSVGGAPSGTITGSPAAGDRRSAIEAAFEAHAGR